MNNNDRQLNILDALTVMGPMLPHLLQWHLGNPYSFNKNVASLLDQGLVVEQVQRGEMGLIYKLAVA